MSARGITIVNASAGSGKTTRLTETVTKAVSPSCDEPVPLEGLFAVTYTRKAHAELATRIRRKLVEEGAFPLCQRHVRQPSLESCVPKGGEWIS